MMNINITTIELIKKFDLKPHPEGGYFKETYRSTGTINKKALPSEFTGDRNYSTAIYFLLPQGAQSSLHRIQSDEIWHFYLGGPLKLVILAKNGGVEEITLGQNIREGQKVQHVVQAGSWFGAYPEKGTEFSFVGCTVAPGFDFSDFEMGKKQDLLKAFPSAKKTIEKLAAA